MPLAVDLCLAVREAGVSVLLDLTGGRLPALTHWGRDLGPLTTDDAAAVVLSWINPVGSNQPDEPVRLALLPEHGNGWMGRPGISGSRKGQAWSPEFCTTEVRIDGESVPHPTDGQLLSLHGPTLIEVDADDTVAELALTLRIEVLTGGVIRSQVELRNLGDAYEVLDCVVAYPVPGAASELLDFAGRWGKERIPQRRELHVGTQLREGRKGRTGADAATLLHLGTPGFSFAEGEIWAVHTGWSGNHTHYAERLSTGEQVIGGGELLLPGELTLAVGDSYTTPWIYGSYGVGLDEVARRFHSFLRARDQHPTSDRLVTINVWEAVYFDHDLEKLITLAESAAELGVERFVLDDGWFGSRRSAASGLGDWTVSTDVWPDGLHPLVDRVTELGMEFGLWFEPEMINLDSDVARAHPDWVMATGDRLPVESRHQQVINLGIPECYAYVRDAILDILGTYTISYIKWDHNRDLVDAGTAPTGRPGVHEQTLACYALMDELKAAHPDLEIESCSSGGARVDLGVLERTDRVWVSDCIDPLERQLMHRWTTQLIPPELMGAHVASGRSHTTGRVHDLGFRAATAIFGHLGIEWDLTTASPADLTELGEWIALYRRHRSLLHSGDLVRLDHPDDSLVAGGVVASDQSAAIFSFASIARSSTVYLGRLRLPGLDPDRRYRVTPLLANHPPHGLRQPPWWGSDGEIELPGSALSGVGMAAAQLDPEQTLLYLVEATS